MACNSYTHTVVITIGRKIGAKEMDATKWADFKVQVLDDLKMAGCLILQHPQYGKARTHDQVGVWEGQREPAAAFVSLIAGYGAIAALRESLAVTAGKYGQEATGCVVTLGTDHLVFPSV